MFRWRLVPLTTTVSTLCSFSPHFMSLGLVIYLLKLAFLVSFIMYRGSPRIITKDRHLPRAGVRWMHRGLCRHQAKRQRRAFALPYIMPLGKYNPGKLGGLVSLSSMYLNTGIKRSVLSKEVPLSVIASNVRGRIKEFLSVTASNSSTSQVYCLGCCPPTKKKLAFPTQSQPRWSLPKAQKPPTLPIL